MAYPSYTQLIGSTEDFDDDRQVDQDVNGAVHIRSFYSGRKSKFTIKHALSKSEYAALLTFYDENRLGTFDFTWDLDDSMHTCVFMSAPKANASEPGLIDVQVVLRDSA